MELPIFCVDEMLHHQARSIGPSKRLLLEIEDSAQDLPLLNQQNG
jgi:hypothetical protein